VGAPEIRAKRIYEQAHAADGTRVLIERIWPRGVSAESAALDQWLPDLAPTAVLRTWFGRDPERFEAYRAAYERELAGKGPAIAQLQALVCRRHCRLTLLYAPRDRVHNHAVILADYLQRLLWLDPEGTEADTSLLVKAGHRARAVAQEVTHVGGA